MLEVHERLKHPQNGTGEPIWPIGHDFSLHNDWQKSERYEILDEPLAGEGVSHLIIQCEGISHLGVYSRFRIRKKEGETITIRDFFTALAYYLHLNPDTVRVRSTGLGKQVKAETPHINLRFGRLNKKLSLPSDAGRSGPRKSINAISALNTRKAFGPRQLPTEPRGPRVFRDWLDGRRIFNGLVPSTQQGDVLLLHLRRYVEGPHLDLIHYKDKDDLSLSESFGRLSL